MYSITKVIDIAGDLYTTNKSNTNTANGRKMMLDLYTLGIASIYKFKEVYGDDEEGMRLIEKYLKYGYDEKNLTIEDEYEKKKLIEILTNGLKYYENEIEIIEELNTLKNSPGSVKDYLVMKKYNSISELIHKIKNAKLVSTTVIDDDKLHEILVYVAWYLLQSKSKRPESLNKLITDIDNKTISIQDIVDGINDLKELSGSDKDVPGSKRSTRKYSEYIKPFDLMDEKNTSYREAVRKMKNATMKNTTVIKGGGNQRYTNSLTTFLHLHRYLNQ